ncbi:hypothetical protein Z042_02060 [Chania multitudinisentens RB-25]|uniref:Transcriptional regulator n=1 Tax=Chania multitudinisentens RB-25 TaxID=1441930 RepID=W0L458_9GAMM|nr:LytTR family DNA-binding domain-containing protein [Chania multitudinisentens]AHG18548.1 hypothetical protein Z042_02060 [Chania multitudinisentens RB-25]
MEHCTALIIDDEPLLRRHLDYNLSELWPSLEIKGTAGDGIEALAMIDKYRPDIIFLDIRMPRMDGLTVAKKLATHNPCPLIIFTTAYDQYAVAAFEHEAIDYLLKPIETRRLELTLERVKKRLLQKSHGQNIPTLSSNTLSEFIAKLQLETPPPKLEWIKASQQDSIHLISVHDIYFFQAEDKYTTVVTAKGEYIIRTSIKELHSQLASQLFWQIHRGILVNTSQIDKVKRDFTGRMHVYLKNNSTKLAVSRSFQCLFKQM